MYEVETAVPLPAGTWNRRKPGPITDQMRRLEPDQSFVIPATDLKITNAHRYVSNENERAKRLKNGQQFVGRPEPKGGYRIWRAK